MSNAIAGRLVAVISVLVLTTPFASSSRAAPPPHAATKAQAEAGAALYAQYCQLCHGARLEGYAADNAPSLASPTFRDTASDAFLQAAIERGRAGTAMAGYGRAVGGPFAPTDVDALVAHIRGGTTPAPLPPKRSTGSPAKGAPVYVAHCQSCHGTADQRANAVHLANPMFLTTASDAYLRAAIVQGRPGTPMEAWSSKLSAREIEDVIAYVRSLARAVPPAPAVVPASAENVPTVLNPGGAPADFTLRYGRYVPVADLAKAYDEKRRLVLIDARPTSDYLRMHIAGAISIPYFDMHDLDKVPNDETWIVAYCVCPHEESGRVVEELRKRGYQHTAILDEGLFVWQQQGHPVTVAAGQLPIPAPPVSPVPLAIPKARATDVGK